MRLAPQVRFLGGRDRSNAPRLPDVTPSAPVYKYTVLGGCNPVVIGTAVPTDGAKKS